MIRVAVLAMAASVAVFFSPRNLFLRFGTIAATIAGAVVLQDDRTCRPVYNCLSEGPLGFCCKAQASMCLLPFLILTGVNVFFMVMEASIGGEKYFCHFKQ